MLDNFLETLQKSCEARTRMPVGNRLTAERFTLTVSAKPENLIVTVVIALRLILIQQLLRDLFN